MHRIARILLAGACPLLLAAAPAAADWDLGLRAGYYVDAEAPMVGIEGVTRMGSSKWFFNPNLELAFADHADIAALSGDFHYDFAIDEPIDLWAGGGPSILFRDPDRGDGETDPGLNLLAGVGFNKGGDVRPYVQGKVVLSDDTEASVAFGVRF